MASTPRALLKMKCSYKKLITVCMSVTVAGYVFLFSTILKQNDRSTFFQSGIQSPLLLSSEKEYIRENRLISGFNEAVTDRCLRWKKDMEWPGQSVTPLISLDPNRIIYSGNLNGPSNELYAFQEAILIGILTNRTIVVPQFVPHNVDGEKRNNEPVRANWRLDVGFLSKFVSMTTIEGMKWRCNSRFDLGFQNRRALCGYDDYIKGTCQMSIHSKHQNLFSSKEYSFMETELDENGKRCNGLDTLPVKRMKLFQPIEDLPRLFASKLPCALLINSYCIYSRHDLIHVDEKLLQRAKEEPESITRSDLASASKSTVAKLVEIFTRRPAYVRDIAQDFMQNVIQDRKYIAIHWRYNEEWKNLFCHLIKEKKHECEVLRHVDDNSIPAAIVHLSNNFTNWMNIKDSEENCIHQHVIKTYFASASENYREIKSVAEDVRFQNEVLSKLQRHEKRRSRCWKIQVFNKDDLNNFIERKYPKSECDLIWRDRHELVSLVENEICKISTVFAFSSISSWSLVAYQARGVNVNFPRSILIWDVLAEVNPSIKKFNISKI